MPAAGLNSSFSDVVRSYAILRKVKAWIASQREV